jgi:hypothetical protein
LTSSEPIEPGTNSTVYSAAAVRISSTQSAPGALLLPLASQIPAWKIASFPLPFGHSRPEFPVIA